MFIFEFNFEFIDFDTSEYNTDTDILKEYTTSYTKN